jgi:hypothetical protein
MGKGFDSSPVGAFEHHRLVDKSWVTVEYKFLRELPVGGGGAPECSPDPHSRFSGRPGATGLLVPSFRAGSDPHHRFHVG